MQSIIKHDRVRVDEPALGVGSALPARERGPGAARSPTLCKKSVQLLREQGVVRAVEVRCSCGEVTVVEFEYGPSAA